MVTPRITLITILLALSTVALGEKPSSWALGVQFYQKGRYFEAITELKRYLFLHSRGNKRKEAYHLIGNSYRRGGRDSLALRYYELGMQVAGPTAGRIPLLMDLLSLLREYGQYARIRLESEELLYNSNPELRSSVYYLHGWTYLQQQRIDEAVRSFGRMVPSPDTLFLASVDSLSLLPEKSEVYATALSYLVPGSGQLYAGHAREAGFSFLLVSTTAASILWDIYHGVYGLAFAKYYFLFHRYYSGGAFHAREYVQEWNRERYERRLDALARRYGDPLERLSQHLSDQPLD